MGSYGKFIAMVLATIVSAIVAALAGDNQVSIIEWFNIGLTGIAAVNVVIVPNLTAGVGRYAKLIVAGTAAGLELLVVVFVDGVTVSEWLQVGLAIAAAVGVGALPSPKHQANSRALAA
jgi:hypothetical protein